ncbi:acyl-ACP desaturase [Rhodococcoides yunnanense]|uniref:acyl-ACP desaturase n=1 Tax=Rhodococcoides yunnanense TaxID=278209 RepID=UPI0009328E04|nr:acyl-ACP desaturase [Rhodococcus yunnanensis]
MSRRVSQFALMRELEPAIERGLLGHVAQATTWNSSDYVEPEMYWGQRRSMLTETAKAALVTTLLTHNNEAVYRADLAAAPMTRSAWSDWTDEWTAEKARHTAAIQDYLIATRSVDPIALDRARFQCMTVGISSSMEGDNFLRSIAYATIDVMATMVSHRNAAVECNDPVASALLGRIVADQELQVAFLRSIGAAALDIAPAQMAAAITEVIMNFQMPGIGLPGFERSAMLIARDGIYDLRRHLDEVLLPALAHWRLFERAELGLGARSTSILSGFLDDLEIQAAGVESADGAAMQARRLRAS